MHRGERYKANWCSKFAEKVWRAKEFFDGAETKIWKRLAAALETPQPRIREWGSSRTSTSLMSTIYMPKRQRAREMIATYTFHIGCMLG